LLEVWDEAKRLRCEWFNDYEKTASKPPMVIADLDVIQLDFRGFYLIIHELSFYSFRNAIFRRQCRLLDGDSAWQRPMGTTRQWNCSARLNIDTRRGDK
jgi:hypothetical protein